MRVRQGASGGTAWWFLLLAVYSWSGCGRLGYEQRDVRADRTVSAGGRSSNDAGVFPTAGRANSGGASGSGGSTAVGGASPGAGGIATGGAPSSGGAAAGASAGAEGTGGSVSSVTDAGVDAGAADSAPRDPYPSCRALERWAFTFDSDPTLHDGDGDGVLDWVVRGGGAFPTGELSGGVWHSAGGTSLDSRPLNDFAARTVVDVRLRSSTVPASHRGAVFWINVDEAAPSFSALFVSVVRQAAGGQELTLFGKDGNTETPLAVFADLPEDFVDVHLDIDPTGHTVVVWIAGVLQNTYSFPLTGVPNGDRFVTLLSWEGASEFDAVDVRTCAP